MSKRIRQGIRTATKYIFLEAAGIMLFKIASAYSYAERGYIAVGGEYFLLLMPLIYKMVADMAKDMARTIKELVEGGGTERRRRMRARQHMAQERSNGR